MTKVLLVEDDNNLREIFEMRLQADGYDTVTAGDGEEALTIAVKEKPDLIIADVMMPKLSGFEMLENLRAVPEMADTKVIMMTALGQAEDRARGEKLGVVKYLVKSQVTLEDFVRVVREVLQPAPSSSATNPAPTSAPDNSSSITNKESELSMPPQDNAPSTNPMPGTPPADNSAGTGSPMGDSPASDVGASGQQ
jgi:DNA-binding response OmpR family regulator